ncbi:hypothetical protein [Baaleninema sp.]|uniref:hypothetical protein n=1 Tax=Baaleninema sp. TaxID=3101197 RepID=UPI003D061300
MQFKKTVNLLATLPILAMSMGESHLFSMSSLKISHTSNREAIAMAAAPIASDGICWESILPIEACEVFQPRDGNEGEPNQTRG